MASTSTQQSSHNPKRLAELLNEQQEPFVLEVYLLERGYRMRRSLDDIEERINGGCSSTKHNNSNKLLKKSSSYHAGIIPTSNLKPERFSSIVRTFLTRFVSRTRRRRRRGTPQEKQVDELSGGRCSFVSCSTARTSKTWSDSETDGESISMPSPVTDEVSSDKLVRNRGMTTSWQFVAENKLLGSDTILDEIDLLQSIPVYNNVRQTHEDPPSEAKIRIQRKVSEDAILSASLWELLVKLRTKKTKQNEGRKPFPNYMESKRVLQKNRQLLFDCVREAVEDRNRQKSSRSKGLIMGPEEIGKVICKNLKTWGKSSADGTNIEKVLRMELFEDEWGGSEGCNREIVREIGNGIVDDIIEDIISEISMSDQ